MFPVYTTPARARSLEGDPPGVEELVLSWTPIQHVFFLIYSTCYFFSYY